MRSKAWLIIALGFLVRIAGAAVSEEEITSCKFDREGGIKPYDIPASSRFTTKRSDEPVPGLIYYLSKPFTSSYPIAILCEGSSDRASVTSVIHFHRYFLQELKELGLGVLTVEQWGVNGRDVNVEEFIRHYTRSQRLQDHRDVITHLIAHPPRGWNGKFVFIGVSEGTHVIEPLTASYSEKTIATISWSGVNAPWYEELWKFIQDLPVLNPPCLCGVLLKSCESCFKNLPSFQQYKEIIEEIKKHPTAEKDFFNMSYLYHADALTFPQPNYVQLKTPFLMVTGAEDSAVQFSDKFVEEAKAANVPITYWRVEEMGHSIRQRPDMIEKSFEWLREKLQKS